MANISIDVGVPAFWLVFHSFFRTSHEPCLSGAKIGSAHLPSGTAPPLCNIASSPHLTVAKSSRKAAHSQLTSHNFIIFLQGQRRPSLSLPQKAPQLVSLTYWQSNNYFRWTRCREKAPLLRFMADICQLVLRSIQRSTYDRRDHNDLSKPGANNFYLSRWHSAADVPALRPSLTSRFFSNDLFGSHSSGIRDDHPVFQILR